MKIKFILSSIFILALNTTCFTQQPDPLSFFPSEVGNVWEYDTPSGIKRLEIIADSMKNGSKYLYYADFFPDLALYEIDSINIYYDPQGLNWLKYKLNADSGKCWTYVPGIDRHEKVGRIDSIYTAFILGKIRVIKEIGYYYVGVVPFKIAQNVKSHKNHNFFNPLTDSGYICGKDIACYCFDKDTTYTYESTIVLVEGIGEYYEYIDNNGPQRILRGAIINGDTLGIITSVKENIVEVPNDFKLYQNYPNPFNPSTTIRYEIPITTNVNLKIFNTLGQEIITLVNEIKHPGNYEVEFNGSGLSSGVYIAVLKTKEAQITRSMLLIK